MNTLMDQVQEQGALFNVRKENLMTESGALVKNRIAIVNEDSEQVVGIVSPKYNMVTNHQVLEHLSQALDESQLDVEGMQVQVRQAYGGARSMVDVVLPRHEIDIGSDKSQLRITALNSYDGRWKYSMKAGAIRMACLNGQILGSFVGAYVEYHNAKLCVETGAKQLVDMADRFTEAEDWWEADDGAQGRQGAGPEDVRCVPDRQGQDRRPRAVPDPSPRVKKLFTLWQAYSKEMGSNAYALYNAPDRLRQPQGPVARVARRHAPERPGPASRHDR